ncbi:MAG TPA: acetylxylan esterase [Phycisphaerae bacterium]|nr:acetylxylan esterase [Phycisphaerae bacterium]HSA29810.1 acetylxylan esterase [Phycisphaerae bacterium]
MIRRLLGNMNDGFMPPESQLVWPSTRVRTRREMIRAGGLGLLGLGFPSWWAEWLCAAEPSAGALTPLNRFPRMVQEYFVRRVRQAQDAGDRLRAELKTKQDAERYVATVRERIRACFGSFPEKTPLNPRVTGVVERDTYRIEKVIFESRPGFLVTGNLYVPKGDKSPRPAVVGTCGHSDNGKAAEAYQSFAQGLARLGYTVLIYDPIGQGERLQYPNEKLKSRIGVGVREHLYCGNQQFLVGEFLGSWRAWDGIRALDYLLTRPEVDPQNVGVTGNSGGGTMTTWLCGLEDRWTMAAPSCFVTTFRRNLENELPADTEQCPPGALALGLDHSDFLAAMAPKPIIILGQEQDFFDRRGTAEAYARLQQLYTLLGAGDRIALFIGPHPHGYSRENREAMYRWFNRVTRVSDANVEPELVIEKDETLQCTPRGQVAELGSRPVYSYTAEISRQLTQRRPVMEGDALRQAVVAALRLPERGAPPDYRILRPVSGRGYPRKNCTTYAVQTEPGMHALVHMLSDQPHYSRPRQDRGRAVLYVAHHSSDAELREEPLIVELIAQEPAATFFACDVRGIGESRPETCGKDMFLNPYGSDFFYAIHSIMLDDPYVGQRTNDVLRVLDWLKSNGCGEVHLAARGWGTLPATFAAMLSPTVVRVTLKNALSSYTEIAESEDYRWPLSAFVPGVLKQFDLPDCYRILASKGLRQIELWGA